MVRKCSVKDCNADAKQKFKFPQGRTDKKRLLKWLAAAGNFSLLSSSPHQLRMKGICRLHFDPKYILAKRLSNTAVPTLHLPDAIDVSTYCIDDDNNNSESEPPKEQANDNTKYSLFGDESDQQTILLCENKSLDNKMFDGAAGDSLVEGIVSDVDACKDNTRYCRDVSNQQSIHRYENKDLDDTVLNGAAGDSPIEGIVSGIVFEMKHECSEQNIQNFNPSFVKESINSMEQQAVTGQIMDGKTPYIASTVQENDEKKVNEICTVYKAYVKAGLETHLVKLHQILEENSSEHTKDFIRNQLQALITAIDNRMT